jgi:hypothetical protein
MLSELLEGIQNEVTDLVQERGRKKGWCAGKIDDLEANLGKLGIDINEKLATIPPKESNRDSKVTDMKEKEQEISIRRDDLRQIEEINEEERQGYFQTRDEHDNLITELNKAKAIIAQIRKNNFLEKKEQQTVLAQLADHSTEALTRIANVPKKSLFTFVMTLAQQVGVQADQDQVKKVIAIIDELIAEEEYA